MNAKGEEEYHQNNGRGSYNRQEWVQQQKQQFIGKRDGEDY
jgi:hypothetical protein